MRRTSFADMNCSIARALDLIGEWWTLLIVREAFLGCQRFGEFEARLGIAPNVLSQRLSRLVEGAILQVTATSQSGKALAYRLTDKGRAVGARISARIEAVLAEVSRELTEEERASLYKSLTAISDGVERLAAERKEQ